ncbi:S-layer homology domain-containing protein [Brevibacillus sp. SYSU BS000544]|uniref:S-layer homology domain-containing protein n=1 Tax=Brevibacillus sp. SYSU BS000544 TaxID=3416443 RepID=UPI003CE55944
MRKLLVMLCALLVVTGCSPDAALLKEAFDKSADITSVESTSTIRLDTNVPTDKLDEQTKLVLALLKEGIIVQSQQKNKQEMHSEISFKNPALIMGSDLWSSEQEPKFDLFVHDGKLAVKSSVDEKFLGFDMEKSLDEQNTSTEETQKELEKLVLDFIKQVNLPLKNVKVQPVEEVTLPNGTKVNATPVSIDMNMSEAIETVAAILDSIHDFPQLETFIRSMDQASPAEPTDIAELKTQLKTWAEHLRQLDITQLKSDGWDGNLSMTYWISAEKEIVQDQTKVQLKVPTDIIPMDLGEKPLEVSLHVDHQFWNYNQEVNYTVPADEDIITTSELAENPDLASSFSEQSPLTMLVAMMTAPTVEDFADVATEHWAYEEITGLRLMGITDGYEDNTFRPQNNITRAEFVKMTVTALGIEPQTMNMNFRDKAQIPGWASESMQTAVKAGLLKGYSDNTIRPNQNVNRAEMITILVRALQLPLEKDPVQYSDKNQIASWALPYVQTAVKHQLINGRTGNRFAPLDNARRDEVAAVLYRILTSDDTVEDTEIPTDDPSNNTETN